MTILGQVGEKVLPSILPFLGPFGGIAAWAILSLGIYTGVAMHKGTDKKGKGKHNERDDGIDTNVQLLQKLKALQDNHERPHLVVFDDGLILMARKEHVSESIMRDLAAATNMRYPSYSSPYHNATSITKRAPNFWDDLGTLMDGHFDHGVNDPDIYEHTRIRKRDDDTCSNFEQLDKEGDIHAVGIDGSQRPMKLKWHQVLLLSGNPFACDYTDALKYQTPMLLPTGVLPPVFNITGRGLLTAKPYRA